MDTQALGRYLSETRQVKELTLEEAVTTLKIRRGILEAFEQGDFTTAGSPVQVRGLLRNYARFLGLEEERVLQYYEAALADKPRRRGWRKTEEVLPVAPRSITDTPPSLPTVPKTHPDRRKIRRGRDRLGSLFTGLIGLAALAFVIFVAGEMLRNTPAVEDNMPTTTAGMVDVAAPSATYTASWTPRPYEEPTLTQIAPPGQPGGGVIVTVELTQRSWLVLMVDGTPQFEGMATPGYFQEVEAGEAVDIKAANAAGLKITVNGLTQTNFGERGQEVQLHITASGVAVVSQSAVATTTVIPETAPGTAFPVESPTQASAALPTLTPFPVPGVTDTAPTQSVENSAGAVDVPVSDTAPQPTLTLPATPPPEPMLTLFVPTLTPLPVMPATQTVTPVMPTLTPFVSPQPAHPTTPVPTIVIPTLTATATATLPPEPTAILPLRVTQSGLPPTKEGRK